MSSSRLPGKAMLPFAGRPLVQHVWSRARCTGYPVFLATSDQPDDDLLARLAEDDGVPVFRGSLDDVFGRAASAARHWNLKGFARLCGDRPFFCIESMTRAIGILADELERTPSNVSVVSNTIPRTPAPGLATEAVSSEALLMAAQECQDEYQREHVTPVFYRGFNRFRTVELQDDPQYYSAPGMAVDTLQDYVRLSSAYNQDPRVELSTTKAISVLRRLADKE